jgi:protease-4
MKQFFKILLASTLGTFLAVILLISFFTAMLVGVISTMEDKELSSKNLKDNSVLRIRWKTEIKDRSTDNPFDSFDPFSMEPNESVGLNEILKTIDKAKNDDKIAGIFLDMETLPAGAATAQEIRNKLLDFKKSGKFIYSYANNYDQKSYYLATVADKIFLNPEGFILFKGLNIQLTFLKGLLDKLGVEAQVIRGPDNKYKSAVEPLIYKKASKANKEQLRALIDAIWNEYLNAISETRNISKKELNRIADNLDLVTSEKTLQYNFTDSIIYRDQVLDFLKKQTETEKINFVQFNKYVNYSCHEKNKEKKKGRVAIIYADGDIVQGKSNDGTIGSESLSETIRKVRNLDRVNAIVLRVTSPGGDALAAEVIRRELELAAIKVPLIVSMGNVAASGGYWISTPGKTIFADASTITGSIGVFGIIPNMQNLFNDKLGITFDDVKTNKNADFVDVMKPLDPFQKAKINEGVKRIYSKFVSLVAKSRKLNETYVDSIARGRVWSGVDAVKIGLVDTLGGLENAVKYAAKIAGLENNYKISEYPVEKPFFEKIVEELTGNMETRFIKTRLGDYYQIYEKTEKLKNMTGIQARLPFIMTIK